MLRICTRSAVVVLCLVTLATTVAAAARSLAFITIDFPGAILTNAQGINAGGEIVGGYTDTAGRQHGFVLSGGQFQSIDVPNSRSTFARGIGPDGEIVMHRAHRVCVVVAPENGTVRKDSLRDRVDVARKVHGFKLSSAVQQKPMCRHVGGLDLRNIAAMACRIPVTDGKRYPKGCQCTTVRRQTGN